MKNIVVKINKIVKNWTKIPDKFKTSLKSNSNTIKDVPLDEHVVVLLLDRQKPSVSPSYDFDEERIGITRTGKIVYGFDSGCSCPSPWNDNYPACYSMKKTWKQFEVELKSFDGGVLEEIEKRLDEVLTAIK